MGKTILIGADIVPTESNFELFSSGNKQELIGEELSEVLEGANFRIFNLEVPLTDKKEPIEKSGPNLIAPTSTIKGLKAISPDFFTLANNHILDQGKQGLDSTLTLLDEAGIAHAGAGKNLEEAAKPYVVDIAGMRVGIYCCAEHEFTIATEKKAGANPFDALYSFEHISRLRGDADYVIVLYHGGKEHYRYPSPYLQKLCRRLIDAGADLVICQHSHCVGCEEKWKSGTIVYGQGNFLFDHSTKAEWQTSILIQIGENGHINYIPLVKNEGTVRLAYGGIADRILSGFWKRSQEITQVDFVENQYRVLAGEMLDNYLFACYGHRNLLFRVMNVATRRRFGHFILNRKYKAQNLLNLVNYIECEAHKELFLTGLKSANRANGKKAGCLYE